jgi:disulfide oxidoreductase YuzD
VGDAGICINLPKVQQSLNFVQNAFKKEFPKASLTIYLIMG